MPTRSICSFAAATLFTLLAACGGDDAGPEPLDTATRDRLCQADCDRLVACEPDRVLAECIASCQGDLAGWVRTDVALDVFDCRAALACGASDDACVTCSPTDAHQRFETACRANLATCDVNPDSFCAVTITAATQGDAGLVCIITPDVVDELTACIPDGVTCAAATTCLQGVFTQHGIDF